MASDGYCRGYVNFAHFFAIFLSVPHTHERFLYEVLKMLLIFLFFLSFNNIFLLSVKDNSLCYDVVYADKEGGNVNNPISQLTVSLSDCQTQCLNNDACKSLSHYTSTFGGVCLHFGSVIAENDLIDKTGATHYNKNCPAGRTVNTLSLA